MNCVNEELFKDWAAGRIRYLEGLLKSEFRAENDKQCIRGQLRAISGIVEGISRGYFEV